MKKIVISVIAVLFLTGCGNSGDSRSEASDVVGSSSDEPASEAVPESSNNNGSVISDNGDTGDTSSKTEPDMEVSEMKITINGAEFSAKFADTTAAEEFKAMLPLTLDMSELNGNEKYFYLDERLTAKSENVGQINIGDIMLYGANCVVLFYDSFSTPYSYTRIGYIENPDGLKKAVGSGNITVTFETE